MRFAVLGSDGLSSNSWKCWTTKCPTHPEKREVYISCRDNFKEVKVSLHGSGHWRMAFHSTFTEKHPRIFPPSKDRAYHKWNEPPPQLLGTVVAFRLPFPISELGVKPSQRSEAEWGKVEYLPVGPPGFTAIATLLITSGRNAPPPMPGAAIWFASLDAGQHRRAEWVLHWEPAAEISSLLTQVRAQCRALAERGGMELPSPYYVYVSGFKPDESRFILGAWANPRLAESPLT